MSINNVTITGNLTRDPELRATPNGTSVLTLGIAVNDRVRNSQTGEWEDYANYFNVVVFGGRADGLNQFLKKGMKVAVLGKLRYRSWDADGQKHSKIEIIADEVDVMSGNYRQ